MLESINRKRPRDLGAEPSVTDWGVYSGDQFGKVTHSDPDIIVLDSDNESNIFTRDDPTDNDVVILEERTLPHDASHFSSSLTRTASPNTNNNFHMLNSYLENYQENYNEAQLERGFQKPRTNSLPQLPHTRISYQKPATIDTRRVLEVKTNLIPYNINYTFGNKVVRRNSLTDSKSKKRKHLEECDDKEGHYIIKTGEGFANNRFTILKLLGQGTFGKVISAYDALHNTTVAIKIIRAVPKYREASKIELRVLSTIRKHDPDNQNHCIQLLECFDYRDHICLVMDLFKISLYDFMEQNKFQPFPGSHIQALAKQMFRSVAFLHDLNLIHTDLKPENVLLHDDSYETRPYMNSQYRNILKDPLIQIIDFGSAIFNDEYHSEIVSTRHYRAPEIILGIGWSFPCDMWSLGCILCELCTGEVLFRTHDNLEHMAIMEKTLKKPMDLQLVTDCFLRYKHIKNDVTRCFDSKSGKLLYPAAQTTSKSVQMVKNLYSLDQLVSDSVGLPMDSSKTLEENIEFYKIKRLKRDTYAFWYYFLDLLKGLLEYDPKRRLKAIEALNHPWFEMGIYDEGTL